MATAKETVSRKPKMDPTGDHWVAGGTRPDNVTARVARARYGAYKYKGSQTGKYMMFLLVDYVPTDDDVAPFTEAYQAGWFNSKNPNFPSPDGVAIAGEEAGADEEFYKALGRGEAEIPEGEEDTYSGPQYTGNAQKTTESYQLLQAFGECGFRQWTDESTCIEGVVAELSRVPKAGKSGTSTSTSDFKVLVPTKIVSEAGGGAGAGSAKSKANGSVAANGAGSAAATASAIDSDLDVAIATLLADAPGNSLTKGKVGGKLVTVMGAQGGAALKRLQEAGYLDGERPFKYDAGSGTLSLG